MNLKELNPQKILFVNPFGIGDVLFTTPVIRNIKKSFPQAKLGYIGNSRTASLLENHPDIDRVYRYDRDEFNNVYKESKKKFWKMVREFLGTIKQERYDVVFDFSLNRNINFLTWLVGIKTRIGLDYKGRGKFLTLKVPFKGFENKHVVEYYLDLLANVGIATEARQLEMFVADDDQRWADEFLKNQGVDAKRLLIGIVPGAGASWGPQAHFRRWGIENYTKLVDKIIAKFPAKIILFGDRTEEELCSNLIKDNKLEIISAQGKTNVNQLAALFKRCHLIILNDGGPLHIAVAMGVKTVSIFGPVDDLVYGPSGDKRKHRVVHSDIACRPCYRQFRMTDCDHISCIRKLEVDKVFAAVSDELLSYQPTKR